MFSYRHAFHAGNHADVLKHMVLVATLKYLGQKDTALTVVDTHAGAGLYRLDQDQAQTSGEASGGVLKLRAALAGTDPAPNRRKQLYVEYSVGNNGLIQRVTVGESDRLRLP